MTHALPALFVSHGAPTLPLEDRPASTFLRGLLDALPERPKAILVVSAHYETMSPEVSTAETPETIYDFGGFPPALYQMTHKAPGAPDVARRAAELLREAGGSVRENPARGYDHGVWTPLKLMDPGATIPVASLSVVHGQSAAWHYAYGRALAPLRDEGVLIIGSGAATHNLRAFMMSRPRIEDERDEARGFADALGRALEGGDWDAVLAGPDGLEGGRWNHPSDDHILPLYVAMGAGGEGAAGKRIHASTNYGVIAMDAYAFDSPEALQAA
ncbi:DODA-type extradiol aromatic ring-opening family dioxygenase [Rhodovulum sp. DZ06]|uniref:DODA-type extradiol aromatic ring-opening family dioxygenase n=1 Tax=Rhodovulum sp. DZ06 TaxID=3425126 RepID=UPI003D32B0FB